MQVEIRTAYTPVPRVTIEFREPSMTQQHFKSDCDINTLIERHARTGMFYDPRQMVNPRKPQYGDFSAIDVNHFQEAQNVIVQARSMFDALPATVRDRFANDPARLLEFIGDESNRDEAIKLGLIVEPKIYPTPGETLVTPPGEEQK